MNIACIPAHFRNFMVESNCTSWLSLYTSCSIFGRVSLSDDDPRTSSSDSCRSSAAVAWKFLLFAMDSSRYRSCQLVWSPR